MGKEQDVGGGRPHVFPRGIPRLPHHHSPVGHLRSSPAAPRIVRVSSGVPANRLISQSAELSLQSLGCFTTRLLRPRSGPRYRNICISAGREEIYDPGALIQNTRPIPRGPRTHLYVYLVWTLLGVYVFCRRCPDLREAHTSCRHWIVRGSYKHWSIPCTGTLSSVFHVSTNSSHGSPLLETLGTDPPQPDGHCHTEHLPRE